MLTAPLSVAPGGRTAARSEALSTAHHHHEGMWASSRPDPQIFQEELKGFLSKISQFFSMWTNR